MEAATLETAGRMGEFTVLRRMAIGGMAEIFLARRDGMSGFEKLVVLKRILPQFAHNQDFVRMFLNEARLAATLHHTNIVQVQGIGEESGQYFFAMEFLHGEDLARVLARATQAGRPLSLDAVLTIMSAVCQGLHYAHERKTPDGRPFGIVHRDVSPHNVFVTYEGGVKLLDFGIAKATGSIGKTRTGVLKGKVAYMSPEQAYSQPVDRRSDIFCIGILLWELTTGRRLYRRSSELETLKALVDHDAPLPSSAVWGYPTELERIVMKCLARDKAQRWETCDELAQSLDAFARAQSVSVSPQIAAKMMRTLFDAEITSFRDAIQSGGSVVEHIVARLELTASRSSVDDWDDVASIIVDLHAVDPEKTDITSVPTRPEAARPDALDGPTVERRMIDVTLAEDTTIERAPTQVEPTPMPGRPATPPPVRAATPPPIAAAPQRPSRPLPGMTPAPPMGAPVAGPAVVVTRPSQPMAVVPAPSARQTPPPRPSPLPMQLQPPPAPAEATTSSGLPLQAPESDLTPIPPPPPGEPTLVTPYPPAKPYIAPPLAAVPAAIQAPRPAVEAQAARDRRGGIHPAVWIVAVALVAAIGGFVALRNTEDEKRSPSTELADEPVTPAPVTPVPVTPAPVTPAPATQTTAAPVPPAPAPPAPAPPAPAPVPEAAAAAAPIDEPTPAAEPAPAPKDTSVAKRAKSRDRAAKTSRKKDRSTRKAEPKRDTPPAVKKPPTKKDLDSLPI